MSKIGISASIDVTKIDKSKLVQGRKGTYLNITAFINLSEVDQYNNNGMVTQSVSSEERTQGVRGAILGNTKVFYKDENNSSRGHSQPDTGFDETDIPF